MNMPIGEALKLLEKYEDAYYNGQSVVSDDVYDSLKEYALSKLPDNHPYIIKVGHEVSSGWAKKSHSLFMGSQNKVCTEDDIKKWVKSIYDKLGTTNVLFVLQHKVDGLSLGSYYRKGVLQDAITRGDGTIGESIIKNAVMFKGLKHALAIEKDVSVRGECFITKEKFDKLQKISHEKYKNARNAASGISRRYDGSHSHFISFIAYDSNAKVTTEFEKVEVLKKLGFITVPTFLCKNIDDIIALYRKAKDIRKDIPYNIDGLVLKVNDVDYQNKLGVERNRPVHQIALKFDAEEAITEVKDIELQIGRTGKYTPVALLTPIDLDGSTISKASLHNFDYIDKNNIGIGATVSISKRGDIIPQVEDVIKIGIMYEKPTICPSCGGKLYDDGTNLWCRAKECKERDVTRIVYWVQTLDMKGFSEKFVEKLWDMGKIRSVGDIYKLTPDDFTAVDGIGEKTVKNFFEILESTSTMMMETFIVAMGIPTCSKTTANDLVENFGNWDKIASLKPGDIQKLPGYAETSSTSICEGIAEVDAMARDLLKVIKIKKKKQGVLTGMSFCVTGSLESMGRKEFQTVVVENGGVAKDTVSEGLTYLCTNDTSSGSKKNKLADKYGVKIINEKQFLKLIGQDKPKDEPLKKDTSGVKLVTENLFD